jgi:threonyl-tRNA synthetase
LSLLVFSFHVWFTEIWDELKADYDKEQAAKPRTEIKITLPDGKVLEGKAWETKPQDIAVQLMKHMAKTIICAKVNGALWDLGRPFEEDATLELLKFDSPEAKDVFWHSSAHILGQAMERVYQGHLCTGPPIAGGGFFYDMGMGEKTVSPNDFPAIQQVIDGILKEKQPFEMMRIPKEKVVEMFGYSPFKTEILSNKVPDTDAEGVGSVCSVYRCGNLIDMCRVRMDLFVGFSFFPFLL